jgi:hypothetical protein
VVPTFGESIAGRPTVQRQKAAVIVLRSSRQEKDGAVRPIRISAPTAEAALALVEMLADYGATPQLDDRGHWEVIVPLDGICQGTFPTSLAAIRDWLDLCEIQTTTVTVDGNTHLLRGNGTASSAVTQ